MVHTRDTTRAARRARFAKTATARVIGTVELLENIILCLPHRDILVNAARVCMLWKTAIDNCPEIQMALFFRPLPGGTVKPYTYEIERPHKWQTAHRGLFWASDDAGPAVDLIRNPFLADFQELEALPSHCRCSRCCSRRYIPEQKLRHLQQRREAWDRTDASWRRMLIIQPPVSQLKAQAWERLMYDEAEGHYIYHNPRGVTLLDLFDAAGPGYWHRYITRIHNWTWKIDVTPTTGDEVKRIERPRPLVDTLECETEVSDDFEGVEFVG